MYYFKLFPFPRCGNWDLGELGNLAQSLRFELTKSSMLICWLRFILRLFLCPSFGPGNPKFNMGSLGNLVVSIQLSSKGRKFNNLPVCQVTQQYPLYQMNWTWSTMYWWHLDGTNWSCWSKKKKTRTSVESASHLFAAVNNYEFLL